MALRDGLAQIRARAREFGPRYAAADVGLRLSRRMEKRLHDAVLEIEGERGVLGPAHQAWRDNTATENRRRWNAWNWSSRGDEWNVSDEWKDALIGEVMLPTIPPGGTVLEIGPGAGRWSVILAPRADKLIAVDVAEKPLEIVAERLAGSGDLECLRSDGASLAGVADGSVDAVWSFDVFVHIAPRDQAAYLDEIARVLRPGGVAAIHHADGRNRGIAPSRTGWRAPMTATLFAALARERGLDVERQVREWAGGRHGLGDFHDVITVMRRGGGQRGEANPRSGPAT